MQVLVLIFIFHSALHITVCRNHHTYPLSLDPLVFVRVKVMLLPTVSRPVSLGVKPHLGPKTRFLLLSDSCGFVDVGHPLWREDGSVVSECCWSSPAQSFSGLSSAAFMTIFLRDSPTWRVRSPYSYPQEQGCPIIPPGTGLPFRCLEWVAGL
jgi:hypothetical protein